MHNLVDDEHDLLDLEPELLARIVADCAAFQANHAHLWKGRDCDGHWTIDEQAGHDFWLARSNCGEGFQRSGDAYSKHAAKLLTKVAESYGEVYL